MKTTNDMKGKTVVITGASDGIGAAAAKLLHARGARVIVVGRSLEKTTVVAEVVGTEPITADFTDLASVRKAAKVILKACPQIDVLINNAGGLWPDRVVTDDGHEQTFQVNYLAPFLLTNLLHERLAASKGRVISTSSRANTFGSIDLDDLESERDYKAFNVYGTTKLENILFIQELVRRWGSEGITAASVHPGVVATQFGRDSKLTNLFYQVLAKPFLRSPEKGAETIVWLATTAPGKAWKSGGYYADRKPGKQLNSQAKDAALARELWDKTSALLSHT
jgi:NAD(P)-dependent dehydrogenase (short-subunit alcohol dehydrogenase family)